MIFQPCRIYGFVRSRQLDGTYPGDPTTGVWPITANRVNRGWGILPENEWPYPSGADAWPPVEPPNLDEKAKQNRILWYQRITSWNECKLALASGQMVSASFEITQQWDNAKNGIIEMPEEGAEIIGSHCIAIESYADETGQFKFKNCWGQDWGDHGFGYLPYEFFDSCLVEAWIFGGIGSLSPGQKGTGISGIIELRWGILDFAGRAIHARELYNSDSDDRLGWAFAVQNQDSLDVEEFYVRPRYRKLGYGTHLLRLLERLSVEAKLPLRFSVPFSDYKPENLSIFERIISKEGYHLFHSGVRWSPLVAVRPVDVRSLALSLPALPELRSPRSRLGLNELTMPVPMLQGIESEHQALPVSEVTELLKQPDWNSHSDSSFLAAAKATFNQHAPILRRLA